MTGTTHIAGGVLTGILISAYLNRPEEKAAVIAISAASSLIPDIDAFNSRFNNKMKLTKLIALFCKHRGIWHTPFLYLVISAASAVFSVPILYSAAFFAGAMSHLLLDSLNPTGVMLLYPISKRYVHMGRIRTSGLFDRLIMIGISIVIFALVKWPVLGL